jgi:hypothetical protein
MFGRELLFCKMLEQDVLFFAMMRPVGVGPNEINGGIYKDRIDRICFPNPCDLTVEQMQHTLDESVFPHQGTNRFHTILSFLSGMNYPAASYGVSKYHKGNKPFAASCGELTPKRD